MKGVRGKFVRFVLLANRGEKHKHEFHFNFRSMYNKTIRFGFCDIQNNQGLDKDYQPQPSAENPYLDLIILDNTKSSSNNSFFLNIRSAISFWSTAIGSISAALSCPVYVPTFRGLLSQTAAGNRAYNSHWLTKPQKNEFLSCYLLALCPI